MKLYTTTYKKICPIDGSTLTFMGEYVPGISFEDAREYCRRNGLHHLEVIGELIAEIPCKEGTYEADFSKKIDYEIKQLN